jgi:lipoprotein-anchoring transpeptidase ErfK/SrfK
MERDVYAHSRSQEVRRSGVNRYFSPDLPISCLSCLCVSLLLIGTPLEAAQKHAPQRRAAAKTAKKPPAAIDMAAIQTQVMLDRAGYSPGEIDGTMGTSTQRALEAYKKSGASASALPEDAMTKYRITEQDAAGPFTPDIPEDMAEKAKLPSLGYRNLIEMLGERFHASPALLKRLNPEAKFAAGEEIQVPNVAASVIPVGPPRGSQADASNPAVTTVTVRKSTSDLTVTDGSGHTLMYAPVTTGSEHDPLPIGDWKVTGVQKDPKFHYNPDLFWDAEPGHSKATIPPGPNNPVGVVWIDISRPHYGLHGTPEPATVGKTASHGCVRLTNWDAQKLASLVRPGTKVVFAE